MKELFSRIYEHISRGERVMLVSVISGRGSVPRTSGAKMVVFSDATTAGTIGGGAVENAARISAAKALSSSTPQIVDFDLSENSASDIGMVCGGSLTVCFQPLDGKNPSNVSLIERTLSAMDAHENAWLITRIREESVESFLYVDGDTDFHDVDMSMISPYLRSKPHLTDSFPSYYIEPVARRETVYVFGGGHVAYETVPLLSRIGFRVCVYEDRADFLTKSRFPNAYGLYHGDFSDFESQININAEDYIIIMTRGHVSDFDVLSRALRTPAHYIGMIGSRRKRASIYSRLYALGFTENDTNRVHSPIGLSIGAETPAEIAVSIVGELIRVRADRRC